MESSDQEIDVAGAMKKVKEEVLESGASFDDIDISSYEINPDFPITYHKPVLGRLNAFIKSLIRRSLRWYVVPIVEQMNDALRAMGELKTVRRLGRLERLSRSMSEQMARLTARDAGKRPQAPPPDAGEAQGPDQFLFQERFRGDEESLKERQRVYLGYFEGRKGVLDLGCGRGEFLELLREKGIEARGVELDEDMVLLCTEKGLKVERAGALSCLSAVPDGSLGGIFMAQVVEHLAPRDLARLLKLCYEKLESGAPLVAETINPSTKSGMDWFYLDMSHVRPVHPSALKLLLESLGFSRTEIRYANPVPEEKRLKKLPQIGRLSKGERRMVESFNRNVEILNEHLFGYQDYAVIAYK